MLTVTDGVVKNLIPQFNEETNCFTQPLFFQQEEEIPEKKFENF